MQQVNILQLQGTGNDENVWVIAGVFASYEEAVEELAAINAEYIEADDFVFTLDDNARVEVWDVVDNNWGY
jgi:hypothetical protein